MQKFLQLFLATTLFTGCGLRHDDVRDDDEEEDGEAEGEAEGETPCEPTDEVCDGADNDCDGLADEDGVCAIAPDAGTESDGAPGEPDAGTPEPDAPTESDAGVEPDASTEPDAGTPPESDCEIAEDCLVVACFDAICFGGECLYALVDADGDAFGASEGGCPGDDCDDADPDVHPGAVEVCENGADDDCVDGDAVCPPEPIPPVVVTYTTPGVVADFLSFSYKLIVGGVAGDWHPDACVATDTATIVCSIEVLVGEAMDFSVQYVVDGAPSWSCIGVGAAGAPNGTVEVTRGELALEAAPVPNDFDDDGNGSDDEGCNLRVILPD